MKLNIYDNTMQNVVKTYETTTFRLPFGVAEDILSLMNDDLFSDDPNVQNVAFMTLIREGLKEIKNILSLMFPDITEDDLNHIDIMELVELLKETISYVAFLIGKHISGKN